MKNTYLSAAAFGLSVALVACGGAAEQPPKTTTPPANPASTTPPSTSVDPTGEVPPLPSATQPPDADKTAADFPDLKIETIKSGAGDDVLAANGTGKFHYTGMLVNGKVFDSSRFNPHGDGTTGYGEPREFGLDGVVKGWKLGLAGMKQGEVRRLTIPGDLAYGPQGSGASIPPNSVLVFEVELVEIVKPKS